MTCSDEDRDRSRKPGAEAGRSRGQVASCAICTWHEESRSVSFLVEPQNQGRRFVSGLFSKPLGRFLAV
jgi:hypothetical protein